MDVVFAVIGGESSSGRPNWYAPGGTIAMPPTMRPKDGRVIFFVVEPDCAQLTGLAQRLRTGQLSPIVGDLRSLSETAVAA